MSFFIVCLGYVIAQMCSIKHLQSGLDAQPPHAYIHTSIKAVATTVFYDHRNDKGQGHKYDVNQSLNTRLSTTNTFLCGKLQWLFFFFFGTYLRGRKKQPRPFQYFDIVSFCHGGGAEYRGGVPDQLSQASAKEG